MCFHGHLIWQIFLVIFYFFNVKTSLALAKGKGNSNSLHLSTSQIKTDVQGVRKKNCRWLEKLNSYGIGINVIN